MEDGYGGGRHRQSTWADSWKATVFFSAVPEGWWGGDRVVVRPQQVRDCANHSTFHIEP